eukprot:GFUD01068994.1.p1 GENE.GFUD01068994.1~~GFUD01068994.1.p1  ORF type:complete len:148 (-),score=38.90 GFUD01068994.1:48-491(-)
MAANKFSCNDKENPSEACFNTFSDTHVTDRKSDFTRHFAIFTSGKYVTERKELYVPNFAIKTSEKMVTKRNNFQSHNFANQNVTSFVSDRKGRHQATFFAISGWSENITNRWKKGEEGDNEEDEKMFDCWNSFSKSSEEEFRGGFGI